MVEFSLQILSCFNLILIAQMLLVSLRNRVMIQVVGHIDSRSTQKACSFVQTVLIGVLIIRIELLTHLRLIVIVNWSERAIVVSKTLGAHINVLFVVKLRNY